MTMSIVLAVDLGGTKTAAARVDDRGGIDEFRNWPAARTLEGSVEQITAAAHEVDAVGVIVPGIYDAAAGCAWCPNLWGMQQVPLRAALEARLSSGVVIDSDRTGYVMGESWLGAGRGLRDVVFVAIGTGIGVGILVDGRVIRGSGGVAGAAGWFALDPAWKEQYATIGCWEAEAAGPALATASGMAGAAAVVAAASAGDETASRALERAACYTGMGVANVVSLLNPELVVLGGGVMVGAGDFMLDRIRTEVARWSQPIAAANCRIELTALGERAGLFGAARLALDAIRESVRPNGRHQG